MKKYLPSILPILVMIGAALAPAAQAFIASHPTTSLVIGTVATVLNHWLPSPKQ